MGLFDSLEGMASQFIGGEAHSALDNALKSSSLGGLSGLLTQLQRGGLASQVQSWCEGAAGSVGPDQLRSVLGDAHIQSLAGSLGISTDQVLATLSQHLPALTAASNAQ
jgi:uncharacterized protein YidB (DUF937 family)